MALYDDLRNSAGNAWDSFKQYFNEGPEQPIAPASIDYGNAYQAQQAVVPNYNSNMVETLQQYTPEYENGELAPGNINLANRTRFDAGNGQQKTILGTSYNIDGVETLIPTVHPETGEDMGEEEAKDYYRKTGEHLGMYDSPDAATAASRSMSENQDLVENPQQPQTFSPAVQQLQTDEGTKRNKQGDHVVYPDTEGYLTAGIGHKLTKAELASGKYKGGMAVPQEQVDKWFKADFKTANNDVDTLYKGVNLNDTSREVLVNMAFNLGRGGLSKFKKMKEGFEAGDMNKAITEMKDSKWWGQVGNRSKRLAKRLETNIA